MNSVMQKGEKFWWCIPSKENPYISEIVLRHNVSVPIAQVLYNRGFVSHDAIQDFLFTSFQKDVFSPNLLKDAQKAVERIIRAIQVKEPILIFGDYDVDGITSSALSMACLLPLGARVNFYLPHRVKDGYGLSTKIVERAAKNGYKVIITVDNGITAFEPALRAKELGIDLIITDHHRVHGAIPDAYAVINPNQSDCNYPFKYFAGVGVVFKLLSLLYEYAKKEMPKKAYELLLLGTVADVVPLTGENRFWVREGLAHVNSMHTLSFQVLCQNGKIAKAELSSTDIGFSIAPQLNALGRLEDPRQGVIFLLGSNEAEVREVGQLLLALNEKRKEIERGIVAEIEREIAEKRIDLETENIIMAASESWPPGVIGLVASRLVSQYGKPALLFHLTKDGQAKGSCRSIQAFNMFEALQKSSHLITQFGGHTVAAGLSLPVHNLKPLKELLETFIADQLKPEDLAQKIELDAHLSLPEVTKKTVMDLKHLEPFGCENRVPSFYIEEVVQLKAPVLLKEAHVKCTLFSEGIIKPLIFFNQPKLYDTLISLKDKPFSVAAQITENEWQGKISIELIGQDVCIKKE